MLGESRWNFYEKLLASKYKELKQLYFQRHFDDWQLSKEESGVKLYTKMDQETGLRSIRGEGIVNAPAKKIMETALNVSEHTQWDNTMEEGKLLESKNDYHVIYNVLKRIGFLTKRDVLTVFSSFHEKDGTIYAVGTSIDNLKQQENPMYVRANVRMAGWILKPLEEDPNSTHVTYILNCDPKGMIPKSLINWFSEQQGMNVRKLGDFVEKKLDPPLNSNKPFFFK